MAKQDRLRKPKYEEKVAMKAAGMDFHNWYVAGGTEHKIFCISKCTGRRRTINRR